MTALQIPVQIELPGRIPNFGTLLLALHLGVSRELHAVFFDLFFKAYLVLCYLLFRLTPYSFKDDLVP